MNNDKKNTSYFIKKKISEGNFKEAINTVKKNSPFSYDNTIVTIELRYNLLEKEKMRGSLPSEKYLNLVSHITSDLLDYLDTLKTNDTEEIIQKGKEIISDNLREVKNEYDQKVTSKNQIKQEITQLHSIVNQISQKLSRLEAGNYMSKMNEFNAPYFDKNATVLDSEIFKLVGIEMSKNLNYIVCKYGKQIILIQLIITILSMYYFK